MRWLMTIVLGVTLAGCGGPPPKVDLMIPVNALCADCSTYVRCEGGAVNAAVYDPTFDLYALEPKDTLGQVATIWAFLVDRVSPRTVDTRPMSIYTQRPGQAQAFRRDVTRNLEANTDLVQHRINLPDGWIDQVNGQWHAADGSLRGLCRSLTREEGRQVAALFKTGP